MKAVADSLASVLPRRAIKLHAVSSNSVIEHSVSSLVPVAMDVVRPGMMINGVYEEVSQRDKRHAELQLRPVMSLKARVGVLHTCYANETLGYDRSYRCAGPTRYAVVSVGYTDGLLSLSLSLCTSLFV